MLKLIGYGFLFFIGFVVLAGIMSDPGPSTQVALSPEAQAKKDAEERQWQRDVLTMRQLRDSMKSPKSFELTQALKMEDNSLCVEYRATNSFNALVPGRAVISNGSIVTSDSSGFAQTWNAHCAGKSGQVYDHIRRAM